MEGKLVLSKNEIRKKNVAGKPRSGRKARREDKNTLLAPPMDAPVVDDIDRMPKFPNPQL